MSEKDDIDKALNYVQGQLQRELEPLIGQKNDADTQAEVKAGIDRVLERMSSGPVKSEIAAIGADFIRAQLSRPSRLADLLPVIKGPFHEWREDVGGVVHWSGFLGERSEHVRMCDFRAILLGAACPNEPISCLWCLTTPPR